MTRRQLTGSLALAKSLPMQGYKQGKPWSGRRAVRAALVLLGGLPTISGCVSVTAPDKPIVIDLNINIKQEVTYRLAADAASTIEKNPEIF